MSKKNRINRSISCIAITGVLGGGITLSGMGTAQAAELDKTIVSKVSVIDSATQEELTGNYFLGEQTMGKQRIKFDFDFSDNIQPGDTFHFLTDNQYMNSAARDMAGRVQDIIEPKSGQPIASYTTKQVVKDGKQTYVWIITVAEGADKLTEKTASLLIDIDPNAASKVVTYTQGEPAPQEPNLEWQELYWEVVTLDPANANRVASTEQISLNVSQKDTWKASATTKPTTSVTPPKTRPTTTTPGCTVTTTYTTTRTATPVDTTKTSLSMGSPHAEFMPRDGIVYITGLEGYANSSPEQRDVVFTFNASDTWKFDTTLSNAQILEGLSLSLADYTPYEDVRRTGTNCHTWKLSDSPREVRPDVAQNVEITKITDDQLVITVKDVPANHSVGLRYIGSGNWTEKYLEIMTDHQLNLASGLGYADLSYARDISSYRNIYGSIEEKVNEVMSGDDISQELKDFYNNDPLVQAELAYMQNIGDAATKYATLEEFIQGKIIPNLDTIKTAELGGGALTFDEAVSYMNSPYPRASKETIEKLVLTVIAREQLQKYLEDHTTGELAMPVPRELSNDPKYKQGGEKYELYNEFNRQVGAVIDASAKAVDDEFSRITKQIEETRLLIQTEYQNKLNAHLSNTDGMVPIGTGWAYAGERTQYSVTLDTNNSGGYNRTAADGMSSFVVGEPVPGVDASGAGVQRTYLSTLDVYLNDADPFNPTGRTQDGEQSDGTVTVKGKEGQDINGTFTVKITNTGNTIMTDPVITLPDGSTKTLAGVKVYPGSSKFEQVEFPLDRGTDPKDYVFKVNAERFPETTDTVTSKYSVTANDNEVYNPSYQTATTAPEKEVTLEQAGDKDIPTGSTYTIPDDFNKNGWIVTIDKDSGTIKATPPATAKTGDTLTIPVVVTYPDGSTDEVSAEVNVEENTIPITPEPEPTTPETTDPEPVDTPVTTSRNSEPTTTKASEPTTTKASEPSTSRNNEPSTSKASEPSTSKASEPSTTPASEPSTTPDLPDLPGITDLPDVDDLPSVAIPTPIVPIPLPGVSTPQQAPAPGSNTPTVSRTAGTATGAAPSAAPSSFTKVNEPVKSGKNPSVDTGGSTTKSILEKIKDIFR